MKTDTPLAFVTKDADGRTVVEKLAQLRLSLVDGPGLLVSHGDHHVLLDGGSSEEDIQKLSTTYLSDDGGGGVATEGLHVDPRKLGTGWAYEIKAEGRRVVWAPGASTVPDWCDSADLVFAAAGATPPQNFAGRIVDASQAGTVFLLRQSSLARSPSKKSINGRPTVEDMRAKLRDALQDRFGPQIRCYVRDFTDGVVVFDAYGEDLAPAPDDGYMAPYSVDVAGALTFGAVTSVKVRTEYTPKTDDRNIVVPVVKATMGKVIKADAAQRYLFAPMYPASPEKPTSAHLDAHDDFGTADDLQAAVWDYVRKGDRTIRLQHLGDTEIGECVEIVSWPFPVTVPLALPDGTTAQKSYEPGTVFMGAVMTPLGWDLAQKGLITGWSLGGSCHRMEVEVAS